MAWWYSTMAPASGKALQREMESKKSFSAVKAGFEEEHPKETLEPGEKHTFALLTPNQHLTSHTYATFNRWVKTHPGWTCKRREATEEECKQHGATNRGKSYFVDVVHEAPDPVKQKRLQEAASKRAAKKAKMEARRDPSTLFGKLPEGLQITVLSYIHDDVPRLKALLSTPYEAVASRDELWEPILQKVLKSKFDRAFDGIGKKITPISKRPKKSTEFLAWFNACEKKKGSYRVLPSVFEAGDIDLANKFIASTTNADATVAAAAAAGPTPAARIEWLVRDVSICEYAIQATSFAAYGERKTHEDFCEDTNRCPGCMEKWGCRCSRRKKY